MADDPQGLPAKLKVQEHLAPNANRRRITPAAVEDLTAPFTRASWQLNSERAQDDGSQKTEGGNNRQNVQFQRQTHWRYLRAVYDMGTLAHFRHVRQMKTSLRCTRPQTIEYQMFSASVLWKGQRCTAVHPGFS
jgi:hypothetical protein